MSRWDRPHEADQQSGYPDIGVCARTCKVAQYCMSMPHMCNKLVQVSR